MADNRHVRDIIRTGIGLAMDGPPARGGRMRGRRVRLRVTLVLAEPNMLASPAASDRRST